LVEATTRRSGLFDLTGRVVVITGGAGLLGEQHARAIAGAGGIPVLVDISGERAAERAEGVANEYGVPAWGCRVDITRHGEIEDFLQRLLERFGRLDVLINNAAHNPKVEGSNDVRLSRFEHFSLAQWEADLAVGLTGTFLCSQVLGGEMARRGRGVIVNVASDLALIAPDQRLYHQPGLPADAQPAKPVSYSVVKTGLLGLTRYLATYWADRGVRANAFCPGGVYNGQPEDFIVRLSHLVPMGRMAEVSEYHGAILFLSSDASSYMTGAILTIDGGRTCW
jgi:NAD(P)-dependent dehydrogenase (short-subunit alcohol dehydrogenase family)